MMQYFSESRCIACDDLIESDQNYLCVNCLVKITPIIHGCKQCGLPLASVLQSQCADCLQEGPKPFSSIKCAFNYDGPVQNLIQQFKYHGKKSYPKKLLACFNHDLTWREKLADVDMVIPVPVSVLGLLKRSYNQATLLADLICEKNASKKINLDVLKQNFWFQKHLTGLDRHARIKLVNKKFYLTKKYQGLLRDKKILLVDDVVTTTATIHACAGLLKKAGAARIDAWALARRLP